jgi:hypothetical protein
MYIQLSGVIWKKERELANGLALFAVDAEHAREWNKIYQNRAYDDMIING